MQLSSCLVSFSKVPARNYRTYKINLFQRLLLSRRSHGGWGTSNWRPRTVGLGCLDVVAERVFMKEVVPAPTYASPRLDVKSYLNDLLKKHKHVR